MLDVHLPHKAIDSVGEFFLHIFTITIGLLIAVGIEAAVERHQHRELAAEAKDTMTAEIRKNDKSVGDALKEIDEEQERLNRDLDVVRKVQLNRKDPGSKNTALNISYNTTGLEDTGWKTAQATGALAFMPYTDAEKFSTIYSTVDAFLKNEDKLADDESSTLGVIHKFHIGDESFTRDAADAMALQLGIWQGHLLALKITARVLQEQQKAYLEGREPSHHMSEQISEH